MSQDRTRSPKTRSLKTRSLKTRRAGLVVAATAAAAALALAGAAPSAGASTIRPRCFFSTERVTPDCGIVKVITTETLASSLNPATAGQAVTFSTSVTAPPVTTAPIGTVVFGTIDPVTQNRTGITTVPLVNGVATWTTSSLAVGVDGIYAAYSGDNAHDGALATYYEQVNPLLPAVTSISPKKGPVDGGTKVTIKGVNFMSVTGISIGNVAVASFSCPSITKCTILTPPEAKGRRDIEVTTTSGTSAPVPADLFRYFVINP